MSTKNKKSAKDLAFEKERNNLKRQIRKLEDEIKKRDLVIEEYKELLDSTKEEVYRLDNWVERLLEYTELSKEDMELLLNKEKAEAELREHLSGMTEVLSLFGSKSLY